MRQMPTRRESPLVYAAVGASLLVVPAVALASSPSADGSGDKLQARAKRRSIAFGHDVVVLGHAPSSDAGQAVTLQFRPAGSRGWEPIDSARIGSDGSFRLIASLTRSGLLRASTTARPGGTSTLPLASSSNAGTTSSSPERVAVTAAIRLHARAINDLGARTVTVRGRLLPGVPGRRILLQGRRAGRWVTMTTTRTGRRGTFILRYRPRGTGQERLRARFAGDRANAAVRSTAGSLTVYRKSVASWYDDGGSTACGFHAYHGVANVSLPCGTAVSFSYHGRTVRAVVDDRGPYVGGRTWDLNQNTAAALGFNGVDAVWSSR